MGKFEKKYNTIQYSDNKKNEKINEKGGEETHVFANFSFFILLVFEFLSYAIKFNMRI